MTPSSLPEGFRALQLRGDWATRGWLKAQAGGGLVVGSGPHWSMPLKNRSCPCPPCLLSLLFLVTLTHSTLLCPLHCDTLACHSPTVSKPHETLRTKRTLSSSTFQAFCFSNGKASEHQLYCVCRSEVELKGSGKKMRRGELHPLRTSARGQTPGSLHWLPPWLSSRGPRGFQDSGSASCCPRGGPRKKHLNPASCFSQVPWAHYTVQMFLLREIGDKPSAVALWRMECPPDPNYRPL